MEIKPEELEFLEEPEQVDEDDFGEEDYGGGR